ncbi:DUF616 domain-containing protein [Candidatus Parcubacteria bacterium]|nr:DUF616 domain-containing protein [Candidatus Parcubacteria bacterium]
MNLNKGKYKKIIIYTAIFGGKDNLIEPKVVPENCDFICFTDLNINSKTWKVVKVEPSVKGDFVRSARKYKILAHRYLSEYKYSIWVDGNLLIRGDVVELINKYLKDANIAVFDHANYKSNLGYNKLQNFLNIFRRKYELVRYCAYEEAKKLIEMNKNGIYKDDSNVIKSQMDRYRVEKYPKNNSVIQSSVLVRRHNSSDVIKTMEDWWKEIKEYSRRDQLSFNYVAWKNKLNFVYMKGDPRKNRYVFRLPHAIKKDFR